MIVPTVNKDKIVFPFLIYMPSCVCACVRVHVHACVCACVRLHWLEPLKECWIETVTDGIVSSPDGESIQSVPIKCDVSSGF